MRKVTGWFARKQGEPIDRVIRASTSSSGVRINYNDDGEHPALIDETEAVHAMSYPCPEFLASAGLLDQFNGLCENAGLTYLVTHQVPQYTKLTYYFVNWFRFNEAASIVEFRLYDDVLTMSLAEFCEVLGVQNVGRMDKMKLQPSNLKALFNSLCSGDPREIRRGKISGIQFPHIRYFAYYIA